MLIIEGSLLGLAYVFAPGPVIVETVRRSVRGGMRTALAVQLGALGARMLFAILVVIGGGGILLHARIQLWVGLLGGVLLVYLGVSALHGWRALGAQVTALNQADMSVPSGPPPIWRQAGVGLIVALASPYGMVFWVSVGGTAMEHSVSGLSGFFLGSLLASVLIALAVGQLHQQRMLRVARWVWGGSGCVLMVFGLKRGCNALALW